jgi:hypothetical protein
MENKIDFCFRTSNVVNLSFSSSRFGRLCEELKSELTNQNKAGFIPLIKRIFKHLINHSWQGHAFLWKYFYESGQTFHIKPKIDDIELKEVKITDKDEIEEIAEAIIFTCNNAEIRKQDVMVALQKPWEISDPVLDKIYLSLYNYIIYDRSPLLVT